MLMPKKVKYRSSSADAWLARPGADRRIAFGEFGLKAMECVDHGRGRSKPPVSR